MTPYQNFMNAFGHVCLGGMNALLALWYFFDHEWAKEGAVAFGVAASLTYLIHKPKQ